MCLYIHAFYLGYIIGTQYMIWKLKNNIFGKTFARTKLTKKELWTFEWPKMRHIFISPCHNHFWVDFSFYFLNMYIKELFRMSYFHMGFLVH
jgi:hypothetical protein